MPTQHEHIVRRFEKELIDLQTSLLEMGSLVENQLKTVIQALTEQNNVLAKKVHDSDEAIDDMEVELDNLCALLIATRQPTAGDMRMIMATLRSICDLERAGDEITKIARLTLMLSQDNPQRESIALIGHLGKGVAIMFRRALDAMAEGNIDVATELTKEDRQIDQLCNDAMLFLREQMEKQPAVIGEGLNLFLIVRALERVADHACNLAEHVVYSVRGKDIRHIYDVGAIAATLNKA